ncbi:hypothetical protein [Aquimarina longa]|nr:hypothetical protein [Aquimarina longa]
MKIIAIREAQKEKFLSTLKHVFKRRARPSSTRIHYRKVLIKRDE